MRIPNARSRGVPWDTRGRSVLAGRRGSKRLMHSESRARGGVAAAPLWLVFGFLLCPLRALLCLLVAAAALLCSAASAYSSLNCGLALLHAPRLRMRGRARAPLPGSHRCSLWFLGGMCFWGPPQGALAAPHCGSPSVAMSEEVGQQALAPAVLRDPVGADERGDDWQQTQGLEHVLSTTGSSRRGRLDRRRSDVQVVIIN